MAKTVPPVDDGPNSATPPDKFEALQFRTLEAEAKAKEGLNSEADQRYWLRWIAVFSCLVIIVTMCVLLSHVAHKLMTLGTFGTSTAYVVAAYVAPIVSITSLSIALLIAAFRGFKDGDGEAGAKAIGEGGKLTRLMS